MNDHTEQDLGWADGTMTFKVEIKNVQEDFFVREISDRMAERVSGEMIDLITDRANKLIEEKLFTHLDATIDKIVEEGLTTELQPSDEFSTPKGEPITPLEYIAKGAESFLEQHVDSKGNAVSPSSMNRTKRRIDQYMEGVITRQFEDEIAKEVRKIKEQILQQMKAAASEWLAKFQAETATGIEQAKALGSTIR